MLTAEWTELRDDRGRLLARLELYSLTLEIRRSSVTTSFDLLALVERRRLRTARPAEDGAITISEY